MQLLPDMGRVTIRNVRANGLVQGDEFNFSTGVVAAGGARGGMACRVRVEAVLIEPVDYGPPQRAAILLPLSGLEWTRPTSADIRMARIERRRLKSCR